MGYECIMCLEDLERNAPKSPVSSGGGQGQPAENNSPRKSTRGRPRKRDQNEDLAEICTTACGHMFHRACLNRWFNETGNKVCPSCRKTVALTKIIRMFPPRAVDNSENAEQAPVQSTSVQWTVDEHLHEQRGIPPLHCQNQDCVDLHEIHKTLVNDFNALTGKYADKVDEVNLLVAKNASLDEEIARLRKISLNNVIAQPKQNPKRSARAIITPKSNGTAKRMRKS